MSSLTTAHLSTTAACSSCALITRTVNSHEDTFNKKWVILHFTPKIAPLISFEKDGGLPPYMAIFFHRDEVSEAFKRNHPQLFTRATEDLNFLYLEGGKLVSSAATPEWDAAKPLPKAFLNITGEGLSCVVCDESNVRRESCFVCKDCGIATCHSCCSNIILAQESTEVCQGFLSMLCPVCRRKKWLRSERWDIASVNVPGDGELADEMFCTLREAIRKGKCDSV